VPAVSRRVALLLVALAFVAALLVGRLRASSPGSGTAAAAAPSSSTAVPAPVAARPLVHVVGAVRHPGVYQLDDGARARDAVAAAGGATRRAALDGLNLAAPVADGEQVVVPVRGGGGAVAPAAAGSSDAPVHLNSATLEQLETLDGVGPALAQRIIDYRSEHGGFRSLDELDQVSGFGPARMAALHGHVAL
jgi:competence protein ComEA